MSDIQSNYPRTQVAISGEKANLVEVSSAGAKGILAVTVITIALILHSIGPSLGYAKQGHTSAYGTLILIIVAVSLAYFVNLYKWSNQAHYALCLLRGYSPRISSTLVGIGCALSFFLLGIPIWLNFDFLISHSDPRNETNKSFSGSTSGLLFFVPYTISWLWVFLQYLPFWSPTIVIGMFYVRFALLALSIWFGCKMIHQIEANLTTLAKIVRQQVEPETIP